MKTLSILGLLFCIQLISSTLATNGGVDHHKQYIVYMGKHSFLNEQSVIDSNHDILASVIGSIHHARNATIHHYHKTFRGFSAMLTPKQAAEISRKEFVAAVFESQTYYLQTTRSWDFLGAPANSIFGVTAIQGDYEVIVGDIDSGIWPEAPSFSAEGLGPVPSRWRGGCWDDDVHCTRKIIGARYYYQGFEKAQGRPISSLNHRYYMSARDDFGHGTHTASTAVGAPVSLYDGSGDIMRGGAPKARLAIYKACWLNWCTCSDLLKAFDDAIYDGVDVISISLGNIIMDGHPTFLEDCNSIAVLHAFQNGVVVSSAAANFHETRTVSNASPWTITVAATSTDREYVSSVQLGDSQILMGYARNINQMTGYANLVVAKDAAISNAYIDRASSCNDADALDYNLIYGKIVVCTTTDIHDIWGSSKYDKAVNVRKKGGVGVIVIDGGGTKEIGLSYDIPLATITPSEGEKLFAYMKSSNRPFAIILRTSVQQPTQHEPTVAYFSSRGPGTAPGIIKPDLAAPGRNILAAWPPFEKARADSIFYDIMSGTSMATPHVTGVAALLKALYPNWSPAEIKSALMTTAYNLDNSKNPIQTDSGNVMATPYDIGSGLLNPNAALNPGLVYDFKMEDIVSYLCSSAVGITQRTLQGLLGYQIECPSNNHLAHYDLNYPSIEVSTLRNQTISIYRTVTYRGKYGDPTDFQVEIENPEGVSIQVKPRTLSFQRDGSKATFRVDITPLQPLNKDVFGSYTWFNNVHRVRSPVAVQAQNTHF